MPNYVLQYDLSSLHIANNGHGSSNVYKFISRRLRRRETPVLLLSTPPPISSQIKPKHNTGMESASLSDSSISATSSSSRCAKKSKTSNGRLQVPTENHLKLRKAIDAGETWEFDLEQVHGLTDEEACVCVSIVTKHLHDESFPPSNGNRLTELAQEGWKTLKEVDRLVKLHPECGNQDKIKGEWVMFGE